MKQRVASALSLASSTPSDDAHGRATCVVGPRTWQEEAVARAKAEREREQEAAARAKAEAEAVKRKEEEAAAAEKAEVQRKGDQAATAAVAAAAADKANVKDGGRQKGVGLGAALDDKAAKAAEELSKQALDDVQARRPSKWSSNILQNTDAPGVLALFLGPWEWGFGWTSSAGCPGSHIPGRCSLAVECGSTSSPHTHSDLNRQPVNPELGPLNSLCVSPP